MADALLDTTFFIDLRRGDPGAVALWESIIQGQLTAAYPVVSAFELRVGQQSADEERFYKATFVLLEEAPLSAPAAMLAGTWLRDLPGATAERLIRDALIAASASERQEPIYTRNRRDFSNFPVRVEDY